MKTIKERNLNQKKILMGVMVVLFGLLMTCGIPVQAGENGSLEYKTVHSYQEMMNYIEGDDCFFIVNAITRDENNGEYYRSIDENWTINIDQPGLLMLFEYCQVDSDHYEIKPFIYSNQMMTKAIDRKKPFSFCSSLSGDKYGRKDCFSFYLLQGTYYLKLKNEMLECGSNVLYFAAFLPFEDICKVNKIEYNDDYSEATVSFTYASDKWYIARIANRENTTQESINNTSYWDKTYNKGYSSEADEFNSILHDGLVLTENGNYSIFYSIESGEYDDLFVLVNFTIDKIGSEASKVEAKSIKLSKKKAELKVGKELTLKTTIKPNDVTDKTVTWKSSNKKVATVDKNGKVTAKKKGVCVITAITSNGKKAKCKITVKK